MITKEKTEYVTKITNTHSATHKIIEDITKRVNYTLTLVVFTRFWL